MVIKTASPGVVVNEIDLTRGTIDAVTSNVGALVGPFAKGPVGEIVRIETEEEFIRVFGGPTDENYEYWWTVNNFLDYGGVCYVVRCDDEVGDASGVGLQTMRNATDRGPSIYVKNEDDFNQNFQGVAEGHFIARSPGTWANPIGVAVIDRGADYQMALKKTGATDIITGDPIDGTFGEATPGSVLEMEVTNPGLGFVAGSSVPCVGGFGSLLSVDITGVEETGPVSAMGAILSGGAGYTDATNTPTSGGTGSGLTLDFNALDSGPLATLAIDKAINNYQRTLQTATLSPSASNIPLTFISTGAGNSASITGSFEANRLASVRIVNGAAGADFKKGDVLTITDINGTPVDALDNKTTLTVTEIDATGAVTSVSIRDRGDGYSIGDQVTLLQVGSTSPAIVQVASVEASGEVTSFRIKNSGQDYVVNDVVNIQAAGGPVTALSIGDPGAGYTPGAYQNVILDDGTGLGAVANITVDALGEVSAVVIQNGGSGYEVGDILTADADRIGGLSTGEVLTMSIADGGSGYQDGAYPGVAAIGGTGRNLTLDVTVAGGVVTNIVISAGGELYQVGDTVSVDDSNLGGLGGAGFSATVDTIDPVGAGLLISVDAVNAIDAEFRITNVAVAGDTIPSGTIAAEYHTIAAPEGLPVGALVQECDINGIFEDGYGHIVSYENGVYVVMVTAGEFTPGSFLTTDGGLTTTGPIEASVPVGQYLLYDASKASDSIINTIFVPNSYTAEDGNTKFGWNLTPRHREKVTLYGITYIYSVDAGFWVAQYQPQEDDLFNDGRYVYRLQAADDWYKNQIAFQGVPWYRFAPRPTATLDALDSGSSGDGLNIIFYDRTGELTGSKGSVLEGYYGVSKFKNATTPEGENNYYIDVINKTSSYVFANRPLNDTLQGELLPIHLLLNAGLDAAGTNMGSNLRGAYIAVQNISLAGGVDNLTATLGELQDGYDKFDKVNVEDLDYILQGPAMPTLGDSVAKANFIISVVESRRDCIAFLSPPRSLVLNRTDAERITEEIVELWADELASSSYAVFDSGYKYSYDRFNDTYRYMPLNGDVAGTLVFSSIVAEPWYSPAGMSRGQIRNVVKMPYDPNKQQRDRLYAARVNPVVTFPGEGTVLYGDKTALAYTSAFSRINVRKLFLVLEKAIAKSSRNVLFEFNDEITRSLFKNNVNPFLRDVQSRRGMYDFLVVCDESNNPPEIVDRNEFVADIYIKPARSINFVTLNFIATKTGVSFDESVGLFRGTGG